MITVSFGPTRAGQEFFYFIFPGRHAAPVAKKKPRAEGPGGCCMEIFIVSPCVNAYLGRLFWSPGFSPDFPAMSVQGSFNPLQGCKPPGVDEIPAIFPGQSVGDVCSPPSSIKSFCVVHLHLLAWPGLSARLPYTLNSNRIFSATKAKSRIFLFLFPGADNTKPSTENSSRWFCGGSGPKKMTPPSAGSCA